jgi:hypothetical protein
MKDVGDILAHVDGTLHVIVDLFPLDDLDGIGLGEEGLMATSSTARPAARAS